MKGDNVSLFPARIGGRVVPAEERASGGSAAGGYSPTEDKVYIPVADTAFARIVRLHESGHAIWSRGTGFTGSDYVAQAVEDAMVHTKLATNGSVRRDELSVAATDIRTAAKRIAQGATDRAMQGLAILRGASILAKPDTSKVAVAMLHKVAAKYHKQGMELVDAILAEVRAGDLDAARALTSKFMAGKDAEEDRAKPDGGAGDGEGSSGESETGEDESESEAGESGEDGSGDESGESDGEDADGESDESDGEIASEAESESESESKPEESKPAKPAGPKPSKPSKPASSSSSSRPEPIKRFKTDTVEKLPYDILRGDAENYIPEAIKRQERLTIEDAARRDEEDGTVGVITGDNGKRIKQRGKKDMPYPKLYVHTLSPDAARQGARSWPCGVAECRARCEDSD